MPPSVNSSASAAGGSSSPPHVPSTPSHFVASRLSTLLRTGSNVPPPAGAGHVRRNSAPKGSVSSLLSFWRDQEQHSLSRATAQRQQQMQDERLQRDAKIAAREKAQSIAAITAKLHSHAYPAGTTAATTSSSSSSSSSQRPARQSEAMPRSQTFSPNSIGNSGSGAANNNNNTNTANLFPLPLLTRTITDVTGESGGFASPPPQGPSGGMSSAPPLVREITDPIGSGTASSSASPPTAKYGAASVHPAGVNTNNSNNNKNNNAGGANANKGLTPMPQLKREITDLAGTGQAAPGNANEGLVSPTTVGSMAAPALRREVTDLVGGNGNGPVNNNASGLYSPVPVATIGRLKTDLIHSNSTSSETAITEPNTPANFPITSPPGLTRVQTELDVSELENGTQSSGQARHHNRGSIASDASYVSVGGDDLIDDGTSFDSITGSPVITRSRSNAGESFSNSPSFSSSSLALNPSASPRPAAKEKDESNHPYLRAKVEAELLSSEETYVNNLSTLVHQFIHPLKMMCASINVTPGQIGIIFSNIELLYNFHCIFYADLKTAIHASQANNSVALLGSSGASTTSTELKSSNSEEVSGTKSTTKTNNGSSGNNGEESDEEPSINFHDDENAANAAAAGKDVAAGTASSGDATAASPSPSSDASRPSSATKVITVAEVILKCADFLRMYSAYLNGYSAALDTIAGLRSNSKFTQFLQEKRSMHTAGADGKQTGTGLDLMSYLILPVQRIPRYLMLLKELIRYTPAEHPELSRLQDAYTKVQSIALHVNEQQRHVENMSVLLSIQNSLSSGSNNGIIEFGQLMQPHRRLIRSGFLHKVSNGILTKLRSPIRKLYLFNDMLLWCEPSNADDINLPSVGGTVAPVHGEKFSGHVQLAHCKLSEHHEKKKEKELKEGEVPRAAFKLTTNKKKKEIIFICPAGQDERNSWMESIKLAIKQTQDHDEDGRKRRSHAPGSVAVIPTGSPVAAGGHRSSMPLNSPASPSASATTAGNSPSLVSSSPLAPSTSSPIMKGLDLANLVHAVLPTSALSPRRQQQSVGGGLQVPNSASAAPGSNSAGNSRNGSVCQTDPTTNEFTQQQRSGRTDSLAAPPPTRALPQRRSPATVGQAGQSIDMSPSVGGSVSGLQTSQTMRPGDLVSMASSSRLFSGTMKVPTKKNPNASTASNTRASDIFSQNQPSTPSHHDNDHDDGESQLRSEDMTEAEWNAAQDFAARERGAGGAGHKRAESF